MKDSYKTKSNSLYLLMLKQVVQFMCWKGKELDSTNFKGNSSYAVYLSPKGNAGVSYFKSEFSKNAVLAKSVFSSASSDEKEKHPWLGWAKLATAVAAWEDYASNLRTELLRSLPHWRTNQSMYIVSLGS